MKNSAFLLTGFRSEHSLRIYTFHRVEADRTRTVFTVSADLAIAAKYSIRVQDLPLLCRGVLDGSDAANPPRSALLSEQDMILFRDRKADAQRAAEGKRKLLRKPPSSPNRPAWPN
jgi:hypothetical protein